MLQKTNKILIGKDIARDTHLCVDGATIVAFSKTTGIADGEILVLDKEKKILAAGATFADTDTIYICQGTGDTYSFTDEAGTSVTSVRKVIVSAPIQGALVRKYSGKSYVAKAEKTAVVTLTGATIVAGTEYICRIIYKDMKEHPGQFTQTYRVIADSTATITSLQHQFATKINGHTGRRVDMTHSDGTTITLTGREIESCCTALTDIDEFDMVDFEVRWLYVNSSGVWTVIPSTSTTVTYAGPTFGSGNWEQVRDMEKNALGYEGITNRIYWPVKQPTMATTVDSYYDIITIEHDAEYLSPDNQYRKQAPLKTVLAMATASTGTNANNQCSIVLGKLNTWMASLPKPFNAVTV
jgi:hypothetical protein